MTREEDYDGGSRHVPMDAEMGPPWAAEDGKIEGGRESILLENS